MSFIYVKLNNRYDVCRAKYRPGQIRVLFVGESRPANGTFFYLGDSRLARYTCEAFVSESESSLDMGEFLERFKENGCFLVDLCPQPVNNDARPVRRAARLAGVPSLAAVIREAQPLAIVVVMKSIAQAVARASIIASVDVNHYVLPFPAQGHERKYVDGLRKILSSLRQDKVIIDKRQQ